MVLADHGDLHRRLSQILWLEPKTQQSTFNQIFHFEILPLMPSTPGLNYLHEHVPTHWISNTSVISFNVLIRRCGF